METYRPFFVKDRALEINIMVNQNIELSGNIVTEEQLNNAWYVMSLLDITDNVREKVKTQLELTMLRMKQIDLFEIED